MSDQTKFTVIGVDPGLTGAFAYLSVDTASKRCALLDVSDMPTATAKVGKSEKSHLLIPELPAKFHILGLTRPDHVIIEEVSAAPGQGVTSMFRFGFVAGALEGVAGTLGLPVTTIRPQKWRQIAGVRQGDDAGRLRAIQLFPNKSELFSRKKDHNRADAVLIAYSYACIVSGGMLVTG